MSTSQPIEADSKQILEALAHGVAGDDNAAWSLIRPIVSRSEVAMYATLCAIAETAAIDARRTQSPGEFFGIHVENVHTGEEASVGVLPVGIRFATQFVTAWANRDEDMAHALYRALYAASPDGLADGMRAVYEMAVVSLRAFLERKRRGGAA